MPSPRAIIKKSKRKENWVSARQSWPGVGQTVDVIAMIMTKATLLEDKPHRVWQVHTPLSACEEVKFWKEIDDGSTIRQSECQGE